MDDVSRIHIPETMIAFAENLDKVEIMMIMMMMIMIMIRARMMTSWAGPGFQYK